MDDTVWELPRTRERGLRKVGNTAASPSICGNASLLIPARRLAFLTLLLTSTSNPASFAGPLQTLSFQTLSFANLILCKPYSCMQRLSHSCRTAPRARFRAGVNFEQPAGSACCASSAAGFDTDICTMLAVEHGLLSSLYNADHNMDANVWLQTCYPCEETHSKVPKL